MSYPDSTKYLLEHYVYVERKEGMSNGRSNLLQTKEREVYSES